jgi:hypothetical protein
MDYQTLKIAIGADRVGIVTMNRPEVRNAMNTQMMTDRIFAASMWTRTWRPAWFSRVAGRLLQRRGPAQARGMTDAT